MEWSDLEVFLAAVRAGSYTTAGRNLRVNRTTVGRRIDALEKALGQPLFEQTPHGHVPTRAGQRLLRAAEAMESETGQLLAELRDGGQRPARLRIVGSGGILPEFFPELSRFRQEQPHIVLEILGELDPLDAVTHRRADLAIAFIRKPPLRLAGSCIGVASQARYIRRDRDAPSSNLGWGYELDAALPDGGPLATNPAGEQADMSGVTTFNSWPQMKQAVLTGFGAASLWCFAADAEPSLRRMAPPDSGQDCPVWLLYRAKAPPSPALTVLMDFLSVAISARINPPQS